MSDRTAAERETRDVIVKSSLTGVAATVIAVTVFSPAGIGGMIGTSMASGHGVESGATDNLYARLPAYRQPLTRAEVMDIQGELARSAVRMELTRAATEAKIEHVRQIAMNTTDALAPLSNIASQADAPLTVAASAPELRLTLTQPAAATSIEVSQQREGGSAGHMTPVSYSGGGAGHDVPYRDPHLELAELMFAHEEF